MIKFKYLWKDTASLYEKKSLLNEEGKTSSY